MEQELLTIELENLEDLRRYVEEMPEGTVASLEIKVVIKNAKKERE